MSICEDRCLHNERQLLLKINRSLDGKNWRKKWEVAVRNITSNSSFHCDWHGILCEEETKHVLGIHLAENNIRGKVLMSFVDVQFLLSLRISATPVQGQFDEIVAKMPNYLVRLDLSDTKVSGRIPNDIAKSVPILSKLQLSGSWVHGEIPDSIGDLTHLTVLSLGETKLNGSVPTSISKLTNLWFLDLETLGLKGNLSFLYNLTKLRYLHLLSNEITGKIPEDIGERCWNLTELLIPNNKLTGRLPRSIGKMKNLSIINVAKNNLSGLVPRDIFKLDLKALILSSNKFTGFERDNNHTFKSLEIFMGSHLPAFNSSLHTLLSYIKGSRETIMQIDISHSNVYGHLPQFIFTFTRLTSLTLVSNNLTGPIPEPFNTMPYFTILDLQDNDFSGHIPQTFSRLIMLKELNVKENKRLKGAIVQSFLRLDYTMGIRERKSDTCPMVRFVHNNGTIYVDSSYYNRSYCYCDEHYFGNGMHCIKCMQGGSCPGTTTASVLSKMANLSRDDHLQIPMSAMFLKQGYFPFPSPSDVKTILKCPSSGHKYRTCAPRKNCRCYVNFKEDKVGVPWRKASSINRLGIYCRKGCLCRLGHHGRYCSQCIEGYYKEGIRCFPCPAGNKKGLQFGILFSATIGSVLISLGILFFSTKRLRLSVVFAVVDVTLISVLVFKHLITAVVLQIVIATFILGYSRHLQRCMALFKSAVFYLQIMDSLISTTSIWPTSIYYMQVYISSGLNLSFSSLACTFPNFFTVLTKSVMLFCLPFACMGLLWSAYYLWKFFSKPTKQKITEFNCKCRKYSIVIIDVAYFPIVKSCFSVIVGCKDIEGVSFMKKFVWIDCNSYEQISLTVIAILELILYLIAVPFLIYLPLLFRNRMNLLDENSPNCNWLSPLIAPYKPKYRGYVEVVMLMRRLLIAILMAAFPDNSSLQIQCITTILLIAIIFQAVTRPFKDPTTVKSNNDVYDDRLGLENGMDIFMLSCVLLSFVCVGLSAVYGTLVPLALFIMLSFTNAVFVIVFCFSVLYRLFWLGSNEEDYGISRDLHEPLVDVNEACYVQASSES